MATSDLRALLAAYEQLFEHVAHRPRRPWRIGTETFVVEHVRATLGGLQRAYSRTVSLQLDNLEDENHRRVEQFMTSLRPSGLNARKVMIGLLVVVIAQILSSVLSELESLYPQTSVARGADRSQLLDALSELANLNVASLVKVARLVVHAGFAGAAVVLSIAGLAAWLVLRPFASGVVEARRLRVADPTIRAGEARLLSGVGAAPPRDSTMDLVVPMLLAGPALLVALTVGKEYLSGIPHIDDFRFVGNTGPFASAQFTRPIELLIAALVVGSLALIRLVQLGRAYLQRRVDAPSSTRGRKAGPSVAAVRTVPRAAPALVASLILLVCLVYSAMDTMPAGVSVRIADAVARVPTGGKFTLDFRCTEHCEFDSARLAEGRGLAARDREVATLSKPDPYASSSGPVVLQLTPTQMLWLSEQRGASSLEILVFDASANRTRVRMSIDY